MELSVCTHTLSSLYATWRRIIFSGEKKNVGQHIPTPVLLPRKSHGRRNLVGCNPWDRKESDTTERLHFHFSFSSIGEGNGNPLQCSCLENPRDGGTWWAAIYGVAQSRTRLKQLSSSSSSRDCKQGIQLTHPAWLLVPFLSVTLGPQSLQGQPYTPLWAREQP